MRIGDVKMFSDEAWESGWKKAQALGLAQVWQPAARPMTKRDVEEIVSAVANHGFEELYAEQVLPGAALDSARPDMIEGLRRHMRDYIAVTAMEAGCVMLTLPREVIDHPARGMTRIRLIAPVRRLSPEHVVAPA